MTLAEHWRRYFEEMRKRAPLTIYYPTCGGGEECITVCPQKDKVWDVVPMRVSLFGLNEKVRLRPFMARPENCLRCYLCADVCPTGAIFRADEEVKRPWLRLLVRSVKTLFRRRYGIKFILRKEHIEKFKRNNFLA